jgi:hypothetical protein
MRLVVKALYFATLSAVLLTLTPTAVRAEIPRLHDVSVALSSTLRYAELIEMHDALAVRRDSLVAAAKIHNGKCQNVIVGTTLAKECADEQSQIEAELRSYSDAVREFHRVYYEETRRYMDRLKILKQNLEKELSKVRAWQEGTREDFEEFNKIRNDAQIDYVNDVFMNIPANEAFARLSELRYLTLRQAAILKTGFHALKATVSGVQSTSTKDNVEKISKILDAHKNLRDAMMDQAIANLDPKARMWLEGMDKVFESAAKVITDSHREDHSWEAVGRTIIEIGVVLYPPASLLKGVDAVGEKLFTQAVLAEPLDSLGTALSQNFRTQKYLQSKLEKTESTMRSLQLAIDEYQPGSK